MNYLLDTNVCIHLFRGEFDLERKINRVGIDACSISEITIAELLYGVENSHPSRRDRNRQNLDLLITAFAGRILLVGPGFSEYARQKAALKRMGRPVGEFDLLIGATALANSLTLVTRNTKDFANLSGMKLENWIDG